MADKTSLTIVTINRIENGRVRPSYLTVQKLADALGIALDKIEFGDNLNIGKVMRKFRSQIKNMADENLNNN